MKKNIIIVSEPNHINNLNMAMTKSAKVIATSNNLKNSLINKGIEAETSELRIYSDEYLIKWMKNLPRIMEKNKTDFLTKISYNELSYWWLMVQWQGSVRVFAPLKLQSINLGLSDR